MYNRNFKIILVISLAFNIAFIGLGVFKYIAVGRFFNHDQTLRHIPQNFKDHFRQSREEMESVREMVDSLRFEFMVELRKKEFHKYLLKEKLVQVLEKQAEMEKILGTNLIELREEMTAEQAEKFFSRFPGEKHHPLKDKRTHFRPRRHNEKPE